MISADIVAHSISPDARQIYTMVWEYPRFIHSEVMTHRQLSKNAASSRAIPAKKVREQVWNTPAMPLRFGANQSGMQAKQDLPSGKKKLCATLWRTTAKAACCFHFVMEKVGLHKQLCNRILEPWMQMRLVVTGTEWANFLWLRDHEDAQPEFQELAQKVFAAMKQSSPTKLEYGQWHLPFVTDYDRKTLSLENQIKLSVSCCAQFSFRKLDRTIGKALKIDKMLKSGDRLHASPFEHQAKCIKDRPDTSMFVLDKTPAGVTHIDVRAIYWSGNLRGWVQNRQLMHGQNMTSLVRYREERMKADKGNVA